MAQDQPPPPGQPPSPPAQQTAVQPAQQPLGQGQLEKLLAPIALYPDDLVAQILTASTYPIEVVQAERWVAANPNLQGNALQDAMQQQSWDPSVKGLAAVPQVLSMMNDKLDWTQQLGEAFLAQPNDVSNAIQQLRAKASANGNLRSSKELTVGTVAASNPPPPPGPPPPGVDPAMLPPPAPPDYITIQPADPGMYYVPIYDPAAAYGPWPWPAYSPFYWYPPGYVLGAAVVGFGVGFFVGAALWSHYNWAGGGVSINVARYNQFNRSNLAPGRGGYSNWQFNAAHRGTVGFQNATLRQQYGGATARGTLQGTPQSLRSSTGPGTGTAPLNAKVNTNANINRNANVNQNANVNRNPNVNQNANVNRNTNVNRGANVNQNANVNRNTNVNKGANVNRNVSATRSVGRPAAGGNKQRH